MVSQEVERELAVWKIQLLNKPAHMHWQCTHTTLAFGFKIDSWCMQSQQSVVQVVDD